MQRLFKHIQGDKTIWVIIGVLSLFSFMPIYSASSNLVYTVGGSTFGYMFKHLVHLFLGLAILYGVHKIPYRFFKGLSMLVLPISIILLIITLTSGTVIQGANASRWIRIPLVGTFQPSALAAVALYVYVAQYMAKIKDKQVTFKESILPLWLPVFLVLIFVLPANFSTAALIFLMVLIITFIGGYPLKYLLSIVGVGLLFLTIFILVAKAFPGTFPHRVDTWISRIDSFSKKEASSDQNYQVNLAKQAIASGGIIGLGPGKSIQKNFLPQSTSDFIFAIIIEEFGFVGGIVIIAGYLMLLLRIIIVARRAPSTFGVLLVIGVGLPIIIQASVNMAVAVQLFPVTGQTLPLISSGGTSIWMVCLALGMILSVSAAKEEVPEEEVLIEDQNPLDILSETI
ncbi:MAG TPA: FtsW/RodA/SpoVE family cell cycle protein [Flavobacteriaceae bacterium]|nr:FtsW/RodA/SpoVE family cell cycle protein [Flavobacteriaceae bacterium]